VLAGRQHAWTLHQSGLARGRRASVRDESVRANDQQARRLLRVSGNASHSIESMSGAPRRATNEIERPTRPPPRATDAPPSTPSSLVRPSSLLSRSAIEVGHPANRFSCRAHASPSSADTFGRGASDSIRFTAQLTNFFSTPNFVAGRLFVFFSPCTDVPSRILEPTPILHDSFAAHRSRAAHFRKLLALATLSFLIIL